MPNLLTDQRTTCDPLRSSRCIVLEHEVRSYIAVARVTGRACDGVAAAAFSAQRRRREHQEDFCSTRSYYQMRGNKRTESVRANLTLTNGSMELRDALIRGVLQLYSRASITGASGNSQREPQQYVTDGAFPRPPWQFSPQSCEALCFVVCSSPRCTMLKIETFVFNIDLNV